MSTSGKTRSEDPKAIEKDLQKMEKRDTTLVKVRETLSSFQASICIFHMRWMDSLAHIGADLSRRASRTRLRGG